MEPHLLRKTLADGLQAFERGDFEAAATLWQQAAQGYAATQQAQVQVKLLAQERFAEPFFWAPFLLINNRL